MMKKRILCVDDDVSVLSSLRTVFRRDRDRWELSFAVGGPAALVELEHQSFDAIVSDMRMPEVDGAMLLELVKRSTPLTVRIMLSGSADREDLERASLYVDELLAKPCSTKDLRETLERLLSLRAVNDVSVP